MVLYRVVFVIDDGFFIKVVIVLVVLFVVELNVVNVIDVEEISVLVGIFVRLK